MVNGPALDETSRRAMQARRFRTQAERAVSDTVYYARQFASIGVDPARIRFADIAHLPPTSKQAFQADPAAFVSRRRRPALVAHSSGTTGRPVQVAFSQRELDTFAALSALGFLITNEIRPADVVCMTGGAAGLSIATYTIQRACERIGAACFSMANLPADVILRRLASAGSHRNTRSKPTVLQAPPTLLGRLIEHGRRLGYPRTDFASSAS